MVEEVAHDDEELQDGGECLVEALDDDAVHGRHVVGDAGHDFPGGISIEPLDGQALELVVELDADDVGEFQLEVVVQVGAEGEKDLPGEDRSRTEESGGKDEIRPVFSDDHINEPHRDPR